MSAKVPGSPPSPDPERAAESLSGAVSEPDPAFARPIGYYRWSDRQKVAWAILTMKRLLKQHSSGTEDPDRR